MTDEPTRPTEEAAPPPAPGASVAPVTATSGPPAAGRLRWAIALGVAGLAIVIGVAAFLLLGARPTPEALKYIPGDAVIVAEVRMDLPGDQLQKVGNLLAHFPGFKDQSTLPDKLDEAFSRALGGAGSALGGAGLDYRTDVKPWLSGPAFIAFRLPAGGGATDATALRRAVISATTTGTVSCATPFGDQPVTHATYRGLDLTIGARGEAACVLDGRQALLGDPQSVRDALDAKAGGSGMDRSEKYRAARAALSGDQLGTVYVDGAGLKSAMPSPTGGAVTPGLEGFMDLAGRAPAWAMAGVRAEDDALVVDGVAARSKPPSSTSAPAATSAMLSLPPTHPSVVAAIIPDDAILLVEHQGTGVALQNVLTELASVPELGSVLGIITAPGGGGQGLVGWIEDAGLVALADGPAPSVGVVLVARDAATAIQQVRTVNNLVALAGLAGEGVEVRQSSVAGVNVTTVTISDLGRLIPPGSVPVGPLPATGPVTFSFAAHDRFVIVGSGEAFMSKLLGVQVGHRLTDAPAWTHAQGRALPNTRASVYLGVPSGLALARQLLPQETLAQLPPDALTYLEPVETVLVTTSDEGELSRSRLVVSVKPQ